MPVPGRGWLMALHARLSRSSSDSLTTDSFSAHIAKQRFHLQLLCLSAGVQRVLMLGKILGVLIARGQLWECSPCASVPGQAVSVGCVGIVEIPLRCLGLESGALWCSGWCWGSVIRGGSSEQPWAVLAQQFSFSFPSWRG